METLSSVSGALQDTVPLRTRKDLRNFMAFEGERGTSRAAKLGDAGLDPYPGSGWATVCPG
jgi:hypothetical protein